MSARDRAILEGTQAAQRLHARLGTRDAVRNSGGSRIDVFRIAVDSGVFVLFRPLDGLLGAYLGEPEVPTPGILVSTQRELHIQRFTGAHELGHFYMHHKPSADNQVGLWRGESSSPQEVAADAFASEFLLPRWLYVHHAGRHRWDTDALKLAANTYQLSLRMGASFEATCWGLQGHKILPRRTADELRDANLKDLKKKTLAGRATLANSWANVWLIDEADDGLTFEGGPNDIVIFRVRERASAGYLWDESSLDSQGFLLLADEREPPAASEYGAEVTRVLVAQVREPGEYSVCLTERRPWHPRDTAGLLSAQFDLQGKERGLARSARRRTAAA